MTSSSAHKQQRQQPTMYGATTAPPPTPSTQPANLPPSSDAADTLSRLLHRLPAPTLSLPTRLSPPATCPPVVSLSDEQNPTDTPLEAILSASSQLGFFQLADHSIPSQLAGSAESESLALFELSREDKESYFPKNWPMGYEGGDDDDDDEDGDGHGESFRLDSSCSTDSSSELSLDSLREFTRAMEKLGMRIVELLSRAAGFASPAEKDPSRFCSLMWISEQVPGNTPVFTGGSYPYIVGLQYQIRSQKLSLMADSSWVSVSPQVDSVMVTLGDIAHVWSNGRMKKVRGRPMGHVGDAKNKSRCVSMSLLVTLPMESEVSPLIPTTFGGEEEQEEEEQTTGKKSEQEGRLFNSFRFEDYAWRVYHERLLFKDPLDRYRV